MFEPQLVNRFGGFMKVISFVLGTLGVMAMGGCESASARFEPRSNLPAIDVGQVLVDEKPAPPEFKKVGTITVVRGSHAGSDQAKQDARRVTKELAAKNGTPRVYITNETVNGRPRGFWQARIKADAGRVP
jgi:hypothetical protein